MTQRYAMTEDKENASDNPTPVNKRKSEEEVASFIAKKAKN